MPSGSFALGDFAVFADVFKANRDLLADARLLHRDTVKGRRRRHGLLAVGDNDELRVIEKLIENHHESTDVGFVERRIDLVQDAERTGAILENRHQQGDRCQRFLTTGKERVAEARFAWRCRDDLDARLERIVPFLENQIGVTTAE